MRCDKVMVKPWRIMFFVPFKILDYNYKSASLVLFLL